MDDLRGKTLRGLFWSLADRLGIHAVQFIITLFLARLLAPEQFGLIGMLSLFINLAQLFLDSGFGAALIQKRNATRVDECSIFFFNIAVGLLVALMLCLVAPLVANFYRQPLLKPLLRLFSLQFIFNSFSLIQTTLLTRRLEFKVQIKANVLALVVSGAIGVFLAYRGFGVWSLAVQSVSGALLRSAALWIICDWRPSYLFRLASLRELFGFGSRLLMSSMLTVVFDNLYLVFIGKAFSARALGFFTRAAAMKYIVVMTTGSALSKVMYPSLASIQDDPTRLKRVYKKSLVFVTFIHFPLMIGLAVIARPLIILLFSAKWLATVPLFQLMCFSGLLYPLHIQNLEMLKVKGRSDYLLKLNAVKRVMIVTSIAITYRWGMAAILTGDIVLSVIGYGLNSYYSGGLVGYSMKEQVADILPALGSALLMGGVMVLAGAPLRGAGPIPLLAVQTAAGVAAYLGIGLAAKSPTLREILAQARAFAAARRAK